MAKKTTKKPELKADQDTIRQAIEELKLNRPYYSCRVVGDRLEFSLYGGELVFWPPPPTKRTRS